MIHVQEWLKETDTELEKIQQRFDTIINKTSSPEIAKQLNDSYLKIERDYIPKGQQLRDKWKEETGPGSHTTYKDIQIHLDKLKLAAKALSTILFLLS